jgi:MinD superfamily P-loop ATPase
MKENIPVLGNISDDRDIAEAYSRGELISRVLPKYTEIFKTIFERILEKAAASGQRTVA